MPSFSTETRDQALLTMVIEEAQKIIEEKGGYLGRTALQKILYFLKVLDVPMDYRFDIHHHGPFCVDILNDADILIAVGVIQDEMKERRKYSDYQTAEKAAKLTDKHSEFLNKNRHKVKIIVEAMLPLSPDSLELIATLDFAYRWVRATGGKGPWKDRVIERFYEMKEKKRDKFPEGDPDGKVSKAYESLVDAGLIEP